MNYRFSFDLGVSSIGAAVFELNDRYEAVRLVDSGVRIFSVSEGAEEKRTKKQARKNNKRTKKRMNILAKKLYENGLWNKAMTSDIKNDLNDISPYSIRKNALYRKLDTPHKIGRAFLHLAKHRGAGYIDTILEEDIDDIEDSEKSKKSATSTYQMLVKHMKENNAKTVGEYFYMRIYEQAKKTKKVVRQKKNHIGKSVDFAISRPLVKEEFNLIWDKQSEYFEQLKSEKLKKEIYEIIFFEKNPAPYATADCIYVDGEKRLLKSHPLSEKRRIFEAVNNIRIVSDIEKRSLTKTERDTVINDLAMMGKNINKTSVRKALGVNKKVDVIFSDKDKGIKPYLYSKPDFQEITVFTSLNEDQLIDMIEFMSEPLDKSNDEGRLMRDDALVEELKSRLKINDEKQIYQILSLLPKGRGSLGKTATIKILKKLKENVISNREATDALEKEGDNRFQSEEVLAQEIQGKYSKLPYYGQILSKDTQPIHPWQIKRSKSLNKDEIKYGKIANLAVHMMLNQLRLVVNDMIRIYGKPYDINIELTRDVGMSTKRKAENDRRQKEYQKINENAVEYLNKHNVRVTGVNILKYKLMMEQNCQDAYNPNCRINPRLSGFEIEHLIPRSQGGSDAYSNLVLVSENENRSKGNEYPYEYFEREKKTEELQGILKFVRANIKMSDAKKWRFEIDAREIFENSGDDDATSRYLTDTSYMSKLSARYLRAILDFEQSGNVVNTRILSVKGNHTAKLRKFWNLDGLELDLMNMTDSVPRYFDCDPYWIHQETGEVKEGASEPDIDGPWTFMDKKRNKEWVAKSRIDHRHHAIDAIALGCINRSFVNHLNFADKKGYSLRAKDYPVPLAGFNLDKDNWRKWSKEFRSIVYASLKNIKISHKPDHGAEGQLHEETGRTIIPVGQKGKTITKYSRDFLDVVKNKDKLKTIQIPEAIKSEWHDCIKKDREKMEKLFSDVNEYYDISEQELANENKELLLLGKKPIALSEAIIIKRAFAKIKDLSKYSKNTFPFYRNNSALIVIEKHKIAYQSGNNHQADFFERNGKVECEVIRRFDANDINFIPDWKREKRTPIWSLQQGDLVEMDTPDHWKVFVESPRCIAEVRKLDAGNKNYVGFICSSDARNNAQALSKASYMKPVVFEQKSANTLEKHRARKIELTPFGKVKRKHKVLKHGKKETR